MRNTISKSQYLKGLQCPKRLWFYRYRKDLIPEVDAATQARFDAGAQIGALAQECFPDGAEVSNEYWDIDGAIQSTKDFIGQGYTTIFEATAAHPVTGGYGRIDVLRKVENADEWDLIEVKSSTSVKDYHVDDIAFQYHVFYGAGYAIRGCYMMLIDNSYIRDGDIEPEKLFHFKDVSQQVLAKQDEVEYWATQLGYVLEHKREPDITIGRHCLEPYECEFRHHCWHHVPDYSILNIFGKANFETAVRKAGSHEIADVPRDLNPGYNKHIDLLSYQDNTTHIDAGQIKSFLAQLHYPLYFLDYETVSDAIPVYDGTRPYQQIPFQFSLHIQHAPESQTQHYEFLHRQKSDPRPAFIEYLLECCAGEGAIVVYNQGFEKRINNELARDYPQFADDLAALNARIVDLYAPFGKRHLYSPEQQSSASIKAVLPTFVPHLSYEELPINTGGDASEQYLNFVRGGMADDEAAQLWSDLLEYCKLDTYAMVELLRVVKEYAEQ